MAMGSPSCLPIEGDAFAGNRTASPPEAGQEGKLRFPVKSVARLSSDKFANAIAAQIDSDQVVETHIELTSTQRFNLDDGGGWPGGPSPPSERQCQLPRE